MILKIDHIAFATSTFDQDIQRFHALGYNTQFQERGLKDLENKREFMHHFGGTLDMALLLRPGSIGIELLDHGHVADVPSYIIPILEGLAADEQRARDVYEFDVGRFARVAEINHEYLMPENATSTDFCCDKVVVDTFDIHAAVQFWCCLGFKINSVSDTSASLEFKPFLGGGSTRMFIRKSEHAANRGHLDAKGFNCLAFFSSDAHNDRIRFEERGMNPTVMNAFRVNQKNLSIFWVRGPGALIAEVIGMA